MSALRAFDACVRDTLQKAGREVHSEVRASTPVDTGRARDGWINHGLANDRVEITNDVPYICRLNDGHSKQSPRGFIQLSACRAIARICT